nr:hypothetical protein [Tanacetum cinerariifolium]
MIICDLNKTPDLFQDPPQNCPKCENPVDGHYCQGCALLRKKFKEDMFTYCIENRILQCFQDTFEPSNDNTNVVNAPQEPFVVKQDPRNSFTYESNSNVVDDSPNVIDLPPQPPLYSCEFCGNDARYGHYCTPQVLFIYSEPCYNQDFNFPKVFMIFNNNIFVVKIARVLMKPTNLMEQLTSMCDMVGQYIQKKEEEKRIEEEQAVKARYWKIPVCYDDDDDDEDCTIAITPILSTKDPDNSLSMGDEHLDTILATKSDEFIKSSVENLVPIPNRFEDFSDSNDDSTSIDDDSFSIDDIEYVEASPPDFELVSSEVMDIVIQEEGRIDADTLLTIKDDVLREKLLNINILIANIEALKDNPTPSSDFMTKSSFTYLNSLLEETNTFDNSLPESKTFYFDLEAISSGSTNTRSDISLPDYESFYDDHVKEISSGSTTTHSDFSLYDLFIFDLSINPFPPAGRSDFYEFTDELAHIISPPEYDCFCFKNEPNLGDFTMDVVEDIFPTREPRVHVHNALPTHPTLQLNLDFILSSESLFTYVVWIFLPFLSYSVAPQYLLSFGNEDTIFDPGISSYHIYSFMPDVSHRSETFIKFNVIPKNLKTHAKGFCPSVFISSASFGNHEKDIKEKDKIGAKTGQNQEQTKSVEKSKVKPDKIEAKETKKSKETKEEGLNIPFYKDVQRGEQQDKEARVGIDLIGSQGKWRVKIDDLSSLTTEAQLAHYHFVFNARGEARPTTNEGGKFALLDVALFLGLVRKRRERKLDRVSLLCWLMPNHLQEGKERKAYHIGQRHQQLKKLTAGFKQKMGEPEKERSPFYMKDEDLALKPP